MPFGAIISARTTPAENTSARALTASSPRLLRCHVGGRSRDRSGFSIGQALGDAEVHHHHSTRTGDHDVLGLEVTMDEPGLVDRLQARQKLRGDLSGFLKLQRPSRLENLSPASCRRCTPSTPALDRPAPPGRRPGRRWARSLLGRFGLLGVKLASARSFCMSSARRVLSATSTRSFKS